MWVMETKWDHTKRKILVTFYAFAIFGLLSKIYLYIHILIFNQ